MGYFDEILSHIHACDMKLPDSCVCGGAADDYREPKPIDGVTINQAIGTLNDSLKTAGVYSRMESETDQFKIVFGYVGSEQNNHAFGDALIITGIPNRFADCIAFVVRDKKLGIYLDGQLVASLGSTSAVTCEVFHLEQLFHPRAVINRATIALNSAINDVLPKIINGDFNPTRSELAAGQSK